MFLLLLLVSFVKRLRPLGIKIDFWFDPLTDGGWRFASLASTTTS